MLLQQPSPSKKASSKHDEELKVLTNMLQSLALTLKKRDKQILKLQEKLVNFNEMSLSLESTEERLVNAVTENQALNRRVRCLQSTKSAEPTNTATTANTKQKTEEYLQLELQHAMAQLRVGEMSDSLAQSRAESDELRDQLDAITVMWQEPKSVADRSDSAVVLSTPTSTRTSAPTRRRSQSAPTSPRTTSAAGSRPDMLFQVKSLQNSLTDLGNVWSSSTLSKEWVSKSNFLFGGERAAAA
jgi:hypothetical protein